MNPAVWVERHGRARPDDPALTDGDRVHARWAMFAARMAGAAGGLRAGLLAVPVNAGLHRDEIMYILGHSGSVVAVTDVEHADDVEPVIGVVEPLQAVVVAPGERWDRLTASTPASRVDRAPRDPAWLFYTSGTTGRPKRATLTNRNLLMASLSYFADIDPVSAQGSSVAGGDDPRRS